VHAAIALALMTGVNITAPIGAAKPIQMMLLPDAPAEPAETLPQPPEPEAELAEAVEVEMPVIDLPPLPAETAIAAEFIETPVPATPQPVTSAVSGDTVLPSLRPGSRPQYPASSLRLGEEGRTAIGVCVDARGRVSEANLVSSSGSPRLDDAALRWIRTERFTPGQVNGQRQAMCGKEIVYEWRLENAG
jgi:protein TonB